ncbi:MAG: RluA family pseudouridine synthase [Ruminococcaceae bacterium]|nr:RluA family pseudouridine synthase [Oscillospiraceae bacterium]
MREIEFIATNEDNGKRIRTFLKGKGFSSTLITRLKYTENRITKNGVFARTIDTLQAGDAVKVCIQNRGHMPAPLKADVEVCYEDEDVLVLNKPPHMPVHESHSHIGDTLSNFVAYHLQGEDNAFRAVYRLDRDTSGLVLVAKHELAASKLAGKVDKHYDALVSGEMPPSGTVDLPIARYGDSIIQRCVDPDGERSVTHFETLRQYDGYAFIRCVLQTGRTHQIRVHMAHLGHPLLGDSLYGGDCSRITRQALHCSDITFIHPVTDETVHLECPYPEDMARLLS